MPQKDDKLLQELVEKYVKVLAKLAYNNGVLYDDAEDVALDGIWAFYKSKYYGNLDEQKTKVMLATIVKRKSIDYYRKTKDDKEMIATSIDTELYGVCAPPECEPERKVIGNEDSNRILNTLDNLKPLWREAVIMHCLEGRSYDEISKALGISEEVCRSRISRAKKFLGEELKDLLK